MRRDRRIVSAQVDGDTAKELEEYARRRGHVKVNMSDTVRELLALGLEASREQVRGR